MPNTRKFCSTVRLPGSGAYTAAKLVQDKALVRSAARSTPSIWICPALGSSTPRIMLIVVVLPAPFGPSRPTISPGATWKLTPFTARTSPNDFSRRSTLRTQGTGGIIPRRIRRPGGRVKPRLTTRRARFAPRVASRLPASSCRAIDLTGRKTRVRHRQLDVDRPEFRRLAGPTERCLAAELLQLLLGRAAADLERRPDRPGSDRVHANALRRKLLRQGLHVVHSRSLRLGVVIEIGRRVVGLFGGGADNGRARRHMRQRRLDDPEWRVNVRLHRRVEILGGNIEDRSAGLLAARVADKDIETAKTARRLLEEPLAESFVPNITGNRQRGSTFGFHELNDLAGVFLLRRQMVDRHVGALARKGDRGGATHPGIAAGDQSLSAGEPTRAAIGRLAVIRTRIHLARQPGPRLLLPAKRRLRVLGSRVLQGFRRLTAFRQGRLLRILCKRGRGGGHKANATSADYGAAGIGKAFVRTHHAISSIDGRTLAPAVCCGRQQSVANRRR